jgi:predicted PurR-regulated permease PerM
MKKIILVLFFAIALNSITTTESYGRDAVASKPQTEKTTLSQKEVSKMVNRLYEIKDMDKSNLTMKQKRELRSEVRAIKSKLSDQVGGGIYLSGAAILLIIVLLIVFL